MAAAPKSTAQDSPNSTELAKDVSTYLDALADGLSEDFPNEAFDNLKVLGRLGVVSRLYERMVKQYLTQFSLMPVELQVLVTLRANVATAPAELATATQQTRAGMTSTLDRLEKRKLLKRIPHETDRRKTLIQLTKTGSKLTNKLVRAQNDALTSMMEGISKQELKRINQSLDQMINLMTIT